MPLLAALVAGAIAWGVVEQIHPVFHVPKEYEVPNLGAPAELFAANRAAQNRADRFNAMLDLALIGSLLAAALTLVVAGRRALIGLIGVPLSALAAAGGGLAGSLVHELWVQQASQPELIHTLAVQVAALAPLGLGVGLATGVAARSRGTALRLLVAGLLGGVLAGLLYPVAVSFLLPAAGTESLIPAESSTRLLWIGLTAGVLGAVIHAGSRAARS